MVSEMSGLDNQNPMPCRVIVYVDGFNLYYGLRQSGWKSLYWLDIHAFSCKLIRKNQQLVKVRYFTSRIKGDPERAKRQNTYLDALTALGQVEIQYGTYSPKRVQCEKCPGTHTWIAYSEKKTDVNIASALIEDAMDDAFDIALLVSGDGDLLAPVNLVRRRFGPGKQVWNAFPPNRPNRDLEAEATGKIRVRRWMLEQSQMPDEVNVSETLILRRPGQWSADLDPFTMISKRHTFRIEPPSDVAK